MDFHINFFALAIYLIGVPVFFLILALIFTSLKKRTTDERKKKLYKLLSVGALVMFILFLVYLMLGNMSRI